MIALSSRIVRHFADQAPENRHIIEVLVVILTGVLDTLAGRARRHFRPIAHIDEEPDRARVIVGGAHDATPLSASRQTSRSASSSRSRRAAKNRPVLLRDNPSI